MGDQPLWSVTVLLVFTAGFHGITQQAPETIVIESSAFRSGESIPVDYTADGKNISPPLSWSHLPAATQELAVILDDPDAPTPQPFVHWVIYKIPSRATGLPAAVPPGAGVEIPGLAGAVQGTTGFSAFRRRGVPVEPGYRGPAPPPGKPHHYRFTVFALSAPLETTERLDKAGLLEAMDGTIIGQGELVGLYERAAPR